MSVVKGGCKCGVVSYTLSHLPERIARCYCATCHVLHKDDWKAQPTDEALSNNGKGEEPIKTEETKPTETKSVEPTEFALFPLEKVTIKGIPNDYPSSEDAVRLYCPDCRTFVFMYHRGSNDIWVYVRTVSEKVFDHVPRYDVFRQK